MNSTSPQKVLVLGVTGMLGNAVFRLFSESHGFEAHGTARSATGLKHFGAEHRTRISVGIDVEHQDQLIQLFNRVRPDVVINCIGLVKQLAEADDPLSALPINALLPHRLARLASLVGARLVHISTDCVFSGTQGNYRESDAPDALDLYGRSKLLGEVDYDNAVTLRTSIIGHELASAHSLVGWFLAQEGRVRGFTRAVFSGLPTVELAKVIRDQVLPRPHLRGLWHVSSDPIGKYDLLNLVKTAFDKSIEIVPDDRLVIDRSLDSSRFRGETGWTPAPWTELVASMRRFG
ncbi:NAD(P)-dependent oxidoreductase [Paucibacter sp. KBW04]|uniref:dTDP-4-dehydrorhamnose reductase family protein n=1 Tax=Paucibacter sp. KBW04 TaxID=2153361 RepID=UPI000F5829DC|nr:SDR family oxidoreductase [Paucibacter sp. KBW04]RQO57394.1 NAD(P)-dependent oxidoreductase [Paucibacter sp. KBW04]